MFKGRFGAMLYVEDLKKSVDFYQNVLGFEFKGYWDEKNNRVTMSYEDASSPTYAEVYAGENALGLHRAENGQALGKGFELHCEVKDIDKFASAVKEKGVTATTPENMPWGMRMSKLTDPDGHAWDFYSSLKEESCGCGSGCGCS